jgi:1,4-dihydroxy-2-naphthoate octaprenyltransferase
MTPASSSPAPPPLPTGAALWVAGARVRTLPAAVVPVLVGTACAFGLGVGVSWWRAVLAGVVALALQLGVNYANDYSDGVRGTDDETRVGPLRLVGSGAASPRAVKRAAGLSFGVGALAGAVLAAVVGPELFVVGAVSIAAGWGYTGGPKPYGYLGLGEVFVFVFFGLVATVGTTYVLVEEVTGLSVVASTGVGALATALLVINNLRDRVGDADSGKRTLSVRIGDQPTRWLYAALLGGAGLVAVVLALMGRVPALLGLVAAPLAVAPLRSVLGGTSGGALIATLGQTGKVQLGYGALLALGLVLGS